MDTHVLNSDVLIDILSYLECKQMVRLERVCKQFGQCVCHLIGQKKALGIGSQLFFPFNNYLPKAEHMCQSIHILEYENASLSLHNNTIVNAIGKLTNVRHLTINDFTADLDTIEEIVNALEWLQRLYLVECRWTQCVSSSVIDIIKLGDILANKITGFLFDCNRGHSNLCIQLIRRLTKLEKLYIKVNEKSEFIKLVGFLPQTIRTLSVSSHSMVFDSEMADSLIESNGRRVCVLNIRGLLIRCDVLEIINRNMDLTLLRYSSFIDDNQWRVLIGLAQRQSNLRFLDLWNQVFEDYHYDGSVHPFRNIKTILLNNSYIKLQTFESLLDLCPNLKTLLMIRTKINCRWDRFKCKTCYNKLFGLISRVQSIRKLVLHFDDFVDSFFQRVNDLKNLNEIHLTLLSDDNSIDYNLFCNDFLEKFLQNYRSIKNKLFTIRLQKDAVVWDDMALPKYVRDAQEDARRHQLIIDHVFVNRSNTLIDSHYRTSIKLKAKRKFISRLSYFD